MPKPTVSTEWASDGGALKLQPTSDLQQRGWDTDDGQLTGVPEKPILQYTNGWQSNVNEWVDYSDVEIDALLAGLQTGNKYQQKFIDEVDVTTVDLSSTDLISMNNLTIGNWYKVSCSHCFNWTRTDSTIVGSIEGFFDLYNGATNITNNLQVDHSFNRRLYSMTTNNRHLELSFQATDTTLIYRWTWLADVRVVEPVKARNIRMTLEEFDPTVRVATTEWT